MNILLSYLLLITSVVAFGEAASAFVALGDVPPLMKSAWRLQITAAAQFLPCIYEWYNSPESCILMIKKYLYIPLAAGFFLGMDFVLWTLSLTMTSIAHSMLFLCSEPVVLVVGSLALMKKVRRTDVIGVMLGMVGMVLVSLDYSNSNSDWKGDMIAFAGCLSTLFYILIGKKALSSYKFPLWSYLIIVNTFAYLYSLVVSGFFYKDWGYFNWMTQERAGYALFLALVPGFFGHTTVNYLTKSLRPVIITAFVNLEPLFGSFIGWFMGYQGIPGYYTWLGGVVMIIGNLIIIVFEAEGKPVKESTIDLEGKDEAKHTTSLLINELVEAEPQL